MPTRLVREGILDSDRVNALDWAAEVFYRRLLNKVDDHGLYDARPGYLKSTLYPVKSDRVREADCTRWLAECEAAGLIVLYEAAGKPFLKVRDTRWQTRSEPKYPSPPETGENNRKQLQTPVAKTETKSDSNSKARKGNARERATPMPEGFVISDRIRSWAGEKGFDRLDEHLEAFKRKCAAKGYTYLDWDAAFMEAIREDWAKLRGGRGVAPPAGAKTIPCGYCTTAIKPEDPWTQSPQGRACKRCSSIHRESGKWPEKVAA